MTKETIIKHIVHIILKYAKPERIYLYGSQTTSEANSRSDIDIAYDSSDNSYVAEIQSDLEKIETLLKIDVKNLNGCGERFTNRVKSTGKVLYSATKQLRAEDGLFNFENALKQFNRVVNRKTEYDSEGFGDIYLDVLTKRFEFTFEMAWKALKRYLDFIGLVEKSPRSVIKEAFAQKIINNETIWLDMIEQRNLSSHIYDIIVVSALLDKSEEFLNEFKTLKVLLSVKLNMPKL